MSNSKNKISKQNFNKTLTKCVEKYKLVDPKSAGRDKVSQAVYQKSFDDILAFQKQFTSIQKKKIDVVVYNVANNDGLFCGYLAWRYLYLENNKEITIFPQKPASSNREVNRRLNNLFTTAKDKVVLIMDLQYGQANLDELSKVAKEIIIIDDHAEAKGDVKLGKNIKYFFGDNKHSAVTYTWKFFYPKEDVPLVLQYIDESDRKLGIDGIEYTNLFASALSFRVTNNPYIPKSKSYDPKADPKSKFYQELNNFFEMGDPALWTFIGNYYEEVVENMKTQIANNYCIKNFQGYKVGMMNFNAPGFLSHKVARQIITNAQSRGEQIDFAVTWGWECGPQAYRVQLIEYHDYTKGPKYNLPQMAAKLSKIGGSHIRGGGGTKFLGNFYWPKKPGMDIWDLFTKKYI